MVNRRYISRLLFCLVVMATTGVGAVDTLQVTTPDPLLEDWRWTEFDRRSGLAGNTRSRVYEDRDGNIWFATDGGAQKYDGLRWTTYTTEDGLAHNRVIKISQARDGAMWIGTGDGFSAGITRLIEATSKGETKATTDTFEGWGGWDFRVSRWNYLDRLVWRKQRRYSQPAPICQWAMGDG